MTKKGRINTFLVLRLTGATITSLGFYLIAFNYTIIGAVFIGIGGILMAIGGST